MTIIPFFYLNGQGARHCLDPLLDSPNSPHLDYGIRLLGVKNGVARYIGLHQATPAIISSDSFLFYCDFSRYVALADYIHPFAQGYPIPCPAIYQQSIEIINLNIRLSGIHGIPLYCRSRCHRYFRWFSCNAVVSV